MIQRRWIIKNLVRLCGLALFLGFGYFAAVFILRGPIVAYRMITNGAPNIYTYTIFPQRAIENTGTVSELKKESLAGFPETVTFPYHGSQRTMRLSDLFTQTDTKAFIVIHDDTVIYETYPNEARRDPINTSFSVAKSVTSALIGIAIDERKINSVEDPVIRYIPELKGRGLDTLTIRHMLTMSSGVPYQVSNDGMCFLALPFSDDAQQYYSPNLRKIALSVQRSDEPIGAYFRYNDDYLLLEGLILERVTGGHVAEYLQNKIWKPLGMEYPASWSLDSEADGFEKTNSALNARAIDFARFGLLFLHKGKWHGRQIISEKWVSESTAPDPTDQRPWRVYARWPQAGGYYKFHWWGLKNPDGTYDYMAWGVREQIIYISPSRNMVVVRFGAEPDPKIIWPFVIRSLIQVIP